MNVYLLFPRFNNEHFSKDVFIFPDSLAKKLNAKFHICYDMKGKVVNFNDDSIVKHDLQLNGREHNSCFSLSKQSIFLMKEAKKIDVLVLFHYRWYSLILACIYKKKNPQGKVYIKCDMSINEARSSFCNGRKIKPSIYGFLNKYIDVISVELFDVFNYIENSRAGIGLKDKLLFIPNGVTENKFKGYVAKENAFLTVGRLGSHQKNSEIILDALEFVDMKDWCFYFVGERNDRFNASLDMLLSKRPELNENLKVVGYVSDPEIKNKYYQRSKIFVLSSRYESYGLVLLEAAAENCYLLSTEVGAINDLLNIYGCAGGIFEPSIENLAREIQQLIDNNVDEVSNDLSDLNINFLVEQIESKLFQC